MKEKIRVYGQSDDNLIVEGAPYPNDEISCFDRIVRIGFTDGTIIEAWYGKKGQAIWTIKVIKKALPDKRSQFAKMKTPISTVMFLR